MTHLRGFKSGSEAWIPILYTRGINKHIFPLHPNPDVHLRVIELLDNSASYYFPCYGPNIHQAYGEQAYVVVSLRVTLADGDSPDFSLAYQIWNLSRGPVANCIFIFFTPLLSPAVAQHNEKTPKVRSEKRNHFIAIYSLRFLHPLRRSSSSSWLFWQLAIGHSVD